MKSSCFGESRTSWWNQADNFSSSTTTTITTPAEQILNTYYKELLDSEMTGTEPNQGGVSTSSGESLVEENHHLVKENRPLAAAIEALGVIVSELGLREEITRNETEREIINLTSKLDQMWSTEQHLCSLIDHLEAQMNGLRASAVHLEMHNANGWGRIRPGVKDLHPGHENPRHQLGGEQGGEES